MRWIGAGDHAGRDLPDRAAPFGGAGLIARTMRRTQTSAKICQLQPQSAAELNGQPRCPTPKRLEFIFGHNGVNEG